MKENSTIVFFGAGAVGSSVGGWVASNYENVYFLDIGKVAETLKSDGITYYLGEEKDQKKNVKVKVISDLSEIPPPDIIAVAVKNYSLEGVSKLIKDKLGDAPIIVGFQNGIDNQRILPQYFSKVIYCIVCYNAWLDGPGIVGYQKKGPLVLGSLDNSLKSEMRVVAKIFNNGVETILTDHLQDAAYSKMIINLTNSLTTLIGHTYQEISDPSLFQKILSNLTYEGIQIVKAEGYKECKLGGMPSWLLMTAGAKLPQFLTRKTFNQNVKKMVISSMAQDILQRGGHQSELESLNGFFIQLADKHGMKIPYNRTIYELCKEEFAKPKFKPLDIKKVWERIEKSL